MTMMIADKLRKSILQAAIQGKLTEQLPTDGDARDLLEKIRAEKQRLIKEKKIKKESPLPAISDEEIPFDIPDNWCWCKLGDLCLKMGAGSTPSGGRNIYESHGVKFIRSQNVHNDGLYLDNIAYISTEIDNKRQNSHVFAKDLLINITGASIGRCALVPDDFDVANINQHVLIIRLIDESIRHFIHSVIISPYIFNTIMQLQVGATKEGLSAEKAKNLIIPLPPLDEQLRIVEKVNELTTELNSLEKDEQILNQLQNDFPKRLKASLLQAAIQGKLTEQLPDDGDARDLLKSIQQEKEKLIKEKKLKPEKPLPANL